MFCQVLEYSEAGAWVWVGWVLGFRILAIGGSLPSGTGEPWRRELRRSIQDWHGLRVGVLELGIWSRGLYPGTRV